MTTATLTRGGLTPAKIVNLVTNEEVLCLFNPYEYTISKRNIWERELGKGKNIPRHNFRKGEAKVLSLILYFDTLSTGEDVRAAYTDKLWTMMNVSEEKKNQVTQKSYPPHVAFEWGKLYFQAIITRMSQKYTLFKEDGTPIRCTVDIELEQFVDENDYDPQMKGSSMSQEAPQATTLIEGQRLDEVASSSSGNPSDYREIAEANNIDDPLNVPPGQTVYTGETT